MFSAASLLARHSVTCVARPGLLAGKYTTNTWSGRVGEAKKYKRRDSNNNMRGYKVRNAN